MSTLVLLPPLQQSRCYLLLSFAFMLLSVPSALSSSSASASADASSLPFQTLDKGQNSAIEDALTEVYRTRHDFETFWQRHTSTSYPPSNIPHVDFTKQMVAVVFRGTHSSGGYDIEITSVDEDDNIGSGSRLVVNFLTSDPPRGAMLTMALTQPYHVISLDVSSREVVFVGSAKPLPPPRFPTFILTLVKEDKDEIVANIRALPSVKNVKAFDRLAIAMVDFDSESGITKDEARSMLEGMEGVKTIEEE